MKRSLGELVAALGISLKPEWQRIEIGGVTEDSRCIRPGHLFVAIRGYVDDGHRYVGEAIARGASVIIVDEQREPDSQICSVPCIRVKNPRRALAKLASAFWGHPTTELYTAGVTGTNGKTTVCHLVGHLLGERETALITTVANEKRNLRAVTTPSSPLIQEIAYNALVAGQKHLVVEVSSASLPLHRVDTIDFDAAVFTNLTHDHLDFHGNRESYLEAKLILFRGLKPAAWAIVNVDDSAAERVLGATRGRPFTFAMHRGADLQATDIRYERLGTTFSLRWEGRAAATTLHLPGEHNVTNALAAASVGIQQGLSLQAIAERLACARNVEGRYQRFRARNGATVIVDFAHSPDSLERMIESARTFHTRIICVFGCPGQSDREKRPLMGKISGRLADLTILTTDNPKAEDPERIIDEIEAGLVPTGGCYERFADRREAIREAVNRALPDEVVLIAGKGHETYQIVGHEFVPFSDAEFLCEEGLAK